jgi:hypothetical protein|tara:strand:+ start:81 stop:254 length:174 start_codon:yes stop_codon:yes gene_type:complete
VDKRNLIKLIKKIVPDFVGVKDKDIIEAGLMELLEKECFAQGLSIDELKTNSMDWME